MKRERREPSLLREMSSAQRRRRRCHCPTCERFNIPLQYHWPTEYDPKTHHAVKFWHNPNGHCGICNDDRGYEHALFVPVMLAEFFETRKICGSCRDGITRHIDQWGLCWASSPDGLLKWALTEFVFDIYRHHFSHPAGMPLPGGFKQLPCCETNHGRATRD